MKKKLMITIILITVLAAGYFLIVKKSEFPQSMQDKIGTEEKIADFDTSDYLNQALTDLAELEKLVLQ